MKITVVGTGYVGLVTGTCFAETGIDVVCIDIDKQKIDNLKNGKNPIYEPGLEKMIEKGVRIKAYDPVAMDECRRRIGQTIEYTKDPYEALIYADALVVVTEWAEFRLPNYKVMEKLMKTKVIFDGRNIYDPVEIKENDFVYYGIGRSNRSTH